MSKAKEFVEKLIESSKVGYKVMRFDGKYAIAGADSRQKFSLKKGSTISMTGNGIYLGTDKQYVLDYYSGLADREVLITFSFDPNKITTGNLTDREVEISVPNAKIVDWEELK